MADLSFVFNPSSMNTVIAANSGKVSTASSAVAARSGTWDKASTASSRIAESSAKWVYNVSDLSDEISSQVAAAGGGLTSSEARSIAKSDSASKIAILSAKVIHSEPGSDSRAIHEIILTSKNSVKYVYSSLAA
jgi:flagellar hook-length control protein FliK